MRKISSETEIEASPAKVWAVLTDGPAHESWNPFIERIDGDLAVGRRLEVKFRNGPKFRPIVTEYEPGKVLEWLGSTGFRGIFDGRHRFELSETATGTRVVQSEEFSGVMVPFLGRMLTSTELNFAKMNRALAERVVS
jgi:hypothetical protein